jgi:hypothetical protein
LRRSYGAASDEPSVFDECFAAMLTLPTLAALLERYEAMAEAARANDWECCRLPDSAQIWRR